MRVKRAKQYRRCMTIYKFGFGFREPFQILVHSDFILSCLKSKLDLKTQLTEIIGTMKLLITNCSLQELKKKEEDIGAFVMARKFEKRRCKHREPIEGIECIKEILAQGNENLNYCVAADSNDLRYFLRNIPGIPLLHVKKSVMVLEPPSHRTLAKYKEIEFKKTQGDKQELNRLKRKAESEGSNDGSSSRNNKSKNKNALKKPKIKRSKEPNPLSIKKKKTNPQKSTDNGGSNKPSTVGGSGVDITQHPEKQGSVESGKLPKKRTRKRTRGKKNTTENTNENDL